MISRNKKGIKHIILCFIPFFYDTLIVMSTEEINDTKEKPRSSGLDNELVQGTIKELSTLLSQVDDSEFIYEFLQCLLSKPEIKAIASRWLIVKEIDEGTTQREIAKKFSMSLCKITRGSKELNKPNSAFRKMLEILNNTK